MSNRIFKRTPLAAGIAALMVTAPVAADSVIDAAEASPDTLDASTAQLRTFPITQHQRQVLDDFNAADADGNGVLTVEEYRDLAPRRAARLGIEPRDNLTAAEMVRFDKEYEAADRSRDGALTFHEVYVFETFDRPGMFPPKPESVPQTVSGRWESLTVAEHKPVYHVAPFSAENHRKARTEGGFVAADSNGDGVVSVFEASDFSLLTWTGSVRAFADADENGDALLTKPEYKRFMVSVAEAPEQADRPGEFPSGRM